MSEQSSPTFKQELGLLDSTLIVVGSMIGSGIFIVSADVLRQLGSPGYLLVAWIITGILTMIGALSYGELAGMMPKAGGQYVYLQQAYHPLVGFLYGWSLFLVIETGTIAAVAVAFARYSAILFPFFDERNVIADLGFTKISTTQLLAGGAVIFLTWVNIQGVREAKMVQRLFTFTKTAALLGLVLLGLWVGLKSEFWAINSESFWGPFQTKVESGKVVSTAPLSGWPLWSAFGLALVGPLFSSSAWNNITYTAGEIKQPHKNIPLSLFWGTLIVSVLYIMANVVYLMLLPAKGSPDAAEVVGRGIMFALNDRVGTAAAEMIFGTAGILIMTLFIMISTFGCDNGIILSGARVYYAMAKDGLFLPRAGQLNKNGVPGFALIIQCVWTLLLCFSGTYGQLLDYVVFTILVFYILTIGAVFVLRKKEPHTPRPYRALGYPVFPLIFILVGAAISVDLLIYKPFTSWAGVIIVATGIPVYYLIQRTKRKYANHSASTY
ncbi:MAG: amino acid permease [Siphonobacter sp.]